MESFVIHLLKQWIVRENKEINLFVLTTMRFHVVISLKYAKGKTLPVKKVQWHRDPEDLLNEEVYRDSCPVCRLFGSTSFIGRVTISDAYLAKDCQQKTEQRDGVGIDRFTGGCSKWC